MTHPQLQVFLAQISIMLAAALFFGLLARKIGQAAVMGELLGGIVLGPTLFGALQPDVYALLFPPDNLIASSRDGLIKVGMLFFMFAAGLEINLAHFRDNTRLIALTSLLGGVLPFALGYSVVILFPTLWQGSERVDLLALFIATLFSISALPVIARILLDYGLIHSRVGIAIMSAAMLDDLVGWSLFAFILAQHANPGLSTIPAGGLAILAVFSVSVIILGRKVLRPVINLFIRQPNVLLGLVAVFITLVGASAERVGLHSIFGAFLLGIALGHEENAQSGAEKRMYKTIELFALNFFAPLYFVSIGIKTNFLAHFDPLLALLLTLLACAGKILGAGLGARLGGLGWRDAFAVGIGLNARGAIGLVLATVALENQLITQRIFVALIFMSLATTLISGGLLKYFRK